MQLKGDGIGEKMNLLSEIINHDIDYKNDCKYLSYFDERKRNVKFKAKIKVPLSIDAAFQLLKSFVLKDLKPAEGEKVISIDKEFALKHNKIVVFHVVDYKENELISFGSEVNGVKYISVYQLFIKSNATIMTFLQVTTYPHAVVGGTGSMVKFNDRMDFKNYVQNIKKYIKNSIWTNKLDSL